MELLNSNGYYPDCRFLANTFYFYNKENIMATNRTGSPNPNWPSKTGNTNPNWPSKTGNPSGGGRGNNPPSGGGKK